MKILSFIFKRSQKLILFSLILLIANYSYCTQPATQVVIAPKEDIQFNMKDIFKALQDNNAVELQKIITQTGDVDYVFRENRKNLLFLAIVNKYFSAAEWLIAHGADVKKVIDGRSLLHIAAQTNESRFVRLLLDNGASPETYEEHTGFTPLHEAVGNVYYADSAESFAERCEMIQELANRCANLESRSRRGKLTPLLKMVCTIHDCHNLPYLTDGIQKTLPAIKILLRAGADKDARDDRFRNIEHFLSVREEYVQTKKNEIKFESRIKKEIAMDGLDRELKAIDELRVFLQELPAYFQAQRRMCVEQLQCRPEAPSAANSDNAMSEPKAALHEFIGGTLSETERNRHAINAAFARAKHISWNDRYNIIVHMGFNFEMTAEHFQRKLLPKEQDANRVMLMDNLPYELDYDPFEPDLKIIEDSDQLGYNPLHVAAYSGNANAVKILLALGAKIGPQTKFKQTALMVADERFKRTNNKDFTTIKELIENAKIEREVVVLPEIWKMTDLPFAQAWQKAESNADRAHVIEKALKAIEAKPLDAKAIRLKAVEPYINNTNFLPYLARELKAEVARIRALPQRAAAQ